MSMWARFGQFVWVLVHQQVVATDWQSLHLLTNTLEKKDTAWMRSRIVCVRVHACVVP